MGTDNEWVAVSGEWRSLPGEISTLMTLPSWPCSVLSALHAGIAQIFAVLSNEPVTSVSPSG
jgi:hypothetical protein